MIRAGLIVRPERYELIHGELRERPRQDTPHIVAVSSTFEALRKLSGPGNHVSSRVPIKGDAYLEPEPDAAVLRIPFAEYRRVGPRWADLALIVEVADTSLADDRAEMADLYARHAVPEYWILDLNARTLEVRRAPRDGVWTELKIHAEDESASPLDAPDAKIPVADLLPPPETA